MLGWVYLLVLLGLVWTRRTKSESESSSAGEAQEKKCTLQQLNATRLLVPMPAAALRKAKVEGGSGAGAPSLTRRLLVWLPLGAAFLFTTCIGICAWRYETDRASRGARFPHVSGPYSSGRVTGEAVLKGLDWNSPVDYVHNDYKGFVTPDGKVEVVEEDWILAHDVVLDAVESWGGNVRM